MQGRAAPRIKSPLPFGGKEGGRLGCENEDLFIYDYLVTEVINKKGGIIMFAVAIDGPSGAGKSSVSKAVAKAAGFVHIDTGALYRSVAYYALSNNIDVKDEAMVGKMLSEITVRLVLENGEQKVLVNGENVTGKIRTENVSMAASDISKIPSVRAFLLDTQRKTADEYNVIMDGRDIATVVLPNADVKIFLTASAEKRAERRFKELLAKNEEVEYNKILEDVIKRDRQDTERETAPLKPSDESVIVDTTEMSFDQSVDFIANLIKERL